MKLIALNLPRSLSENELALLFKKHGNIQGCSLVKDAQTGLSKGFGFVKMALDHEAEIAINELHGSKVSGQRIRVKYADATPETPAVPPTRAVAPEKEGE